MPLRPTPETHPFFGTLFRVPDSHTFLLNRARSDDDDQDAANATSEIQRFSGLADCNPVE
jgi:hypothetical protein